MWKRQGNNTCVYCRTEWKAPATNTSNINVKGGARLSEGYVNVGHLQGQSTERDTSTYYNRWNNRWGNRWNRW